MVLFFQITWEEITDPGFALKRTHQWHHCSDGGDGEVLDTIELMPVEDRSYFTLEHVAQCWRCDEVFGFNFEGDFSDERG